MSTFKTLDTVAAAASTVAGFLRSVERRAAVLAELQCGDPEQGAMALSEAFENFAKEAQTISTEDWPLMFWSMLLQSPALLNEALAPFWNGDMAPLAKLEFAPRAALLLRVVAGLTDAEGARVFGVEEANYRLAVRNALPQRAEGSADGEAWLAMNREARYLVEDLTPEQVAAIARMREDAVARTVVEPVAMTSRPSRRSLPTLSFIKPGWLGKLRVSMGLR